MIMLSRITKIKLELMTYEAMFATIDYLGIKMVSNEKSFNYYVVGVDKSYNFRINFIFIQIHMKELFFKDMFSREGKFILIT
jgi:hypothetical protein